MYKRQVLHTTERNLEKAIVASGISMSPPPYRVTTFFRRCLLGAFLSKILTKNKVLDGTLRYCVARSQRPTTTTSILRPCRPQFYVHVDLNFTFMSTSILRPCRPQFYVHFDLNFTSMSTSVIAVLTAVSQSQYYCRGQGTSRLVRCAFK